MGNSGECSEDKTRELVLDGKEDSTGNWSNALPEPMPYHLGFQHPKITSKMSFFFIKLA